MSNRLIYASSRTCADLLYLSGFAAEDPFLLLELTGTKYIVVSALEIGRAVKQAASDVHACTAEQILKTFGLPSPEKPLSTTELILRLAEAQNIRQWDVPMDFPYGMAKTLLDAGIALTPLASCAPQRSQKTQQEIAYIRHAIAITEIGLKRAQEILASADCSETDGTLRWNGETLLAETLRAEINIAIARHGGTASDTIAAPGIQAADPHTQGVGPIHAHEPIVIDVFPRDNATGYFGDLTRTLVKGSAPDIVQKAFHAVYETQQRAIAMLKPGITGDAVHHAAADFLTQSGFATDLTSVPARGFFHGLGHGIGLEIHEGPTLSTRGSGKFPLVSGNVVTVEPGVYYPEWGGIRIEDDVLITDSGSEVLSHFPVFLEV